MGYFSVGVFKFQIKLMKYMFILNLGYLENYEH